ncbi:hypothetical protein NUW54_g14057 [Trametes sanguinea]|uniref:Uncharacterized protein n=1 Tax=Trametes sanguinea TaxID=158606 RepID=A0ACC1MFK9_9APHY|nr:hypothetical protein NUW54_g14057 [Trametes sanguinea]
MCRICRRVRLHNVARIGVCSSSTDTPRADHGSAECTGQLLSFVVDAWKADVASTVDRPARTPLAPMTSPVVATSWTPSSVRVRCAGTSYTYKLTNTTDSNGSNCSNACQSRRPSSRRPQRRASNELLLRRPAQRHRELVHRWQASVELPALGFAQNDMPLRRTERTVFARKPARTAGVDSRL